MLSDRGTQLLVLFVGQISVSEFGHLKGHGKELLAQTLSIGILRINGRLAMVDSRRDGGQREGESAELASSSRNRSENSAVECDAPTQNVAQTSQDAGPAERVGGPSEPRLKVPTHGEVHVDESGVRKAAMLGDIMTRAEVASLLRCSEPHVVALVEREALPGFRLGRPWRFRRSEVLAWCERRAHGRRSA